MAFETVSTSRITATTASFPVFTLAGQTRVEAGERRVVSAWRSRFVFEPGRRDESFVLLASLAVGGRPRSKP
jgi:hypothetical protein